MPTEGSTRIGRPGRRLRRAGDLAGLNVRTFKPSPASNASNPASAPLRPVAVPNMPREGRVMTPIIRHCTPETITDAAIVDRYHHLNRLLKEELPDDPPLVLETQMKSMRCRPPKSRQSMWLAYDSDRIVASASCGWMELDTNRHVAGVDVNVEAGYRRRGLGTRLMRLVLDATAEADRNRLLAGSVSTLPAGEAVLKRWGFERALENHMNQLDLARLDHALMAEWRRKGEATGADYQLEIWDGPVPESSIEAFADLANVMNSEPRGSLDIEDTTLTPVLIRENEQAMTAAGFRWLQAVVRHRQSGRLAGFTEMSWNPLRAPLVWQHGTGVQPEHRGHGLGRWLKAANIQAMLAENPAARFVRTGNADVNAPMLAINRAMGFAPFYAAVEWQATVEGVRERLPTTRRPARRPTDAPPDNGRLRRRNRAA